MTESLSPVTARAFDFDGGQQVAPHRHDRAQLVYASSGIMRVSTSQGVWVVPPERAVWIPSGIEHEIHMRQGPVSMRTLYFKNSMVRELPRRCRVVHISPLLRELILRSMGFDATRPLDARQKRLTAVLIDEIRTLPETPLHLPSARDPRLRRLLEEMRRTPSAGFTLEAWGKRVGASGRTLSRLFDQETGMTFRRWREQLRLITAIERLANGEPVTTIAADLGYESMSAFIAMFRRNLGTTPSRYFNAER